MPAAPKSQEVSWWMIARDGVVLIGLLAGLNWLLAPDDAGWTGIQPSPWLLVPMLMGLRYGIAGGVGSGALIAGAMAYLHHTEGVSITASEFAGEHAPLLVALILAGFICGEARALWQSSAAECFENSAWLEGENSRLLAEVELGRHARHQLQTRLALWNAPVACLDDELRRLALAKNEALPEELLALLYRTCHVTASAMLRCDGRELIPAGVFYASEAFAKKRPLAAVPMARQALDSWQMLVAKEAAVTSGELECLAMIPWKTKEGSGVIVVEDLPLEHFQPEVMARAELLVHWTCLLRDLRAAIAADAKGLLPMDTFLELAGQLQDAAGVHQIPSTSVTIRSGREEAAGFDRLRQAVHRALPAVAATTVIPGDAGIVVLLPFAGDGEAAAMAGKVRSDMPGVEITQLTVTSGCRVEELWAQMLGE